MEIQPGFEPAWVLWTPVRCSYQKIPFKLCYCLGRKFKTSPLKALKKKHCLDLQNTDLMSWKLCAQRGIVWYSFSSNLNLTPCKLDAQKEINMHLFCWPTLWPFIPLPFHWHSLISHCLDQMTLQRGSVDRLYNFETLLCYYTVCKIMIIWLLLCPIFWP